MKEATADELLSLADLISELASRPSPSCSAVPNALNAALADVMNAASSAAFREARAEYNRRHGAVPLRGETKESG